MLILLCQECPTLWRIYEYVSDAERKATLEEREGKASLEIGEGGEGYIGPEDWCYNCGGCGHLGDVSIFGSSAGEVLTNMTCRIVMS